MTQDAPVGAFDSGVGGLSILKEIRAVLPAEDLIYLADSAHCPYGTKPVADIRQRVLEVTDFLVSLGAKAVVVACNSASVAGLDQLRQAHPNLPIVGVEPAIKPAHDLTKNGRIGVLATSLTLQGDRFSMLVERYGTGIELYTQPAPGLVELVEAGKVDTTETEQLLHEYLDPLLEKRVDTIVLGCTHYPFLKEVIQKIAGPAVSVLDTGAAVAKQTLKVLDQSDLLRKVTRTGNETFYTSGNVTEVREVISKLWIKKPVTVLKSKV